MLLTSLEAQLRRIGAALEEAEFTLTPLVLRCQKNPETGRLSRVLWKLKGEDGDGCKVGILEGCLFGDAREQAAAPELSRAYRFDEKSSQELWFQFERTGLGVNGALSIRGSRRNLSLDVLARFDPLVFVGVVVRVMKGDNLNRALEEVLK